MSDWEVREWRTVPKGRYAFAFLGAAVVVSSVVLGASMAAIPGEGGFDDDQMRMVAENRLSAVEALWVGKVLVQEGYAHDNDLPGLVPLTHFYCWLDYSYDRTVRWMVQSYFMLQAEMRYKQSYNSGYVMMFHDLLGTLGEKFGSVEAEGTYCAWELWYNGSRVHFGSEAVDGPDLIPEAHWTVAHDYSWDERRDPLPFQARLVFHLWFETEAPVFE